MPPLSGMTTDDIVDRQEVKVSYCPWLLDPDNKDCDWVDKELRTTISECLNHKSGDRPTLESLLEAAKNGYRKRFHGEDDGYIRSWIRKWLYDASIQTGDAQSGGAGGGGPPGAGPPEDHREARRTADNRLDRKRRRTMPRLMPLPKTTLTML